MTTALLACFWVASHHGLRRGSARLGVDDSPRLWALVADVTAALGHPPAPSPWTVRR